MLLVIRPLKPSKLQTIAWLSDYH